MTGQDTLPRGVGRNAGGPSRGLKFFPALCAVIVVGLTVYASQRLGQLASAPERPAAHPAVQEKEGEASASKAVAAAKNFLDKLDKAGRDKAVLDFDSKKKPSWSNLPVTM